MWFNYYICYILTFMPLLLFHRKDIYLPCKARHGTLSRQLTVLSETINYLDFFFFFAALRFYKEANYKGHYCGFIPKNNFRAVSWAGMKSVSSLLFSGCLGCTMRIDFLSDSPETLQGSHLSKKGSIMFPYCTYQGRKSKRIYFTETPQENL